MSPTGTRVIAFPRYGSPYTECFYNALESFGVPVLEGDFSGRWLLRNVKKEDYVHFHWPSFFYAGQRRGAVLQDFTRFLFFLGLIRWRGARLIWTVHNLRPHEPCIIPHLDTIARSLVLKMACRLLVHGRSAEAEVRRAFPTVNGRVALIDHGHWRGFYPDTMDREAARARLGLSNRDYVFLFLGLCRPYKNLEGLIRAFEQLPGTPVLVIAGKFQDLEYEARIRFAVQQSHARILFHCRFIPDADLQIYLRACDAVATPYTETLTSGTAILALSFGRPVIAPELGCLGELITKDCGILYNPSVSDGLLHAMRQAMMRTFDESEILARVSSLDWTNSARALQNSLLSRAS